MKPIYLGVGLAPAVTVVDGLVYVAFGIQPDALVLVVLTTAGLEVRRTVIADGFFNSFPRFSGPWLVYKRNHDWRAAALHVQSGQAWTYRGQADGNFGVVVNAALNLVAYQWTASYMIWLGSLVDGGDAVSPLRGAPDGLDVLVDASRVTLRKDTRQSVPGMTYPVTAGGLTVGERPDAGVAVQLSGAALRVALGGQDTPVPSAATDGETYAIVTGGPQGVRVLLGTIADLLALPLATTGPDKVPGPVNTDEDRPTKEEPPMAESLTPQVLQIVSRYAAKFPVPSGPTPADEAFENVCRRWCYGLAQQVKFETRDERWGVKNAGGGRPQSKDSITYNGPRLLNYDLLSGVGTGRPVLISPAAEDITGQTFMPVQAADLLGGSAPPIDHPPVGQPPASAGLDEAAIRRIVADELAKPRKVALKTWDDAHYLCAEEAGGREVNATRTSAGPWETFTLEPK